MTVATLSNPLSYPLHPITWRPDMPKHYRVTNPFTGPDLLNGGIHRATDVGNFGMDDPVLAPASCRAVGRRHHDSALGVVFDLSHGVLVELWHLNATLAPIGTWQNVAKGQVVGRTGNTGARLPDGSPMPAHTHIAASRNGVPFDIEPYLPMPERPARPIILEDDDMKVPADVGYLATGTIGANNRLRAEHASTEGSIVLDRAVVVYVFGVVRGGTPYNIGGRAGSDWYYVGFDGRAWYAAKPLVTGISATGYLPSIVPLPSADCSAQETTIAQLQNRIARAKTSAAGAAQAATTTVEALT